MQVSLLLDGIRTQDLVCITFLLVVVYSASHGLSVVCFTCLISVSSHDSLYQALVRHMSMVTAMLHTRRAGVVTKRSIS